MTPYYEHGGITIYHGDCLEVMPQLSAETIVTDPPYFLPARHYCTRKAFPRSLSDVSMLEHFYRAWYAKVDATLGEDGVAYIFCDGQSYPVFYALGYPLFKSQRPLIWDKGVAYNGYAWRHQHELVLFAERDAAPPIKTGDGDVLRCRAVKADDREHPAQKPTEILRKLIAKHSGRVLDPFAGSGATLLAAAQLGREAVGIEREERYCEIAAKRLAQEVLPLEQGA